MTDADSDLSVDLCEHRHDFGDGETCIRCGFPRPLSSQEIYRLEKMRRGLSLQEYQGDGKRSRKHDSTETLLACPNCGSELISVRPTPTKTRKARCLETECGYEWRTSSREAFGGFRNVEVRG